MKKSFFKLSLISLFTFGALLSSCVENSSSSSSLDSSSSAASSSVQMTDYVSQAKLTNEYSGKHFLTDGIGKVTLSEKVDGDTAHFKQIDGSTLTIKGRYLCIDTPESTGMVEAWGHDASDFNGNLLNTAKTIVLSSDNLTAGGTYTAPSLDSTGSRYLVYVWVSTTENAPIADLTLVNLALVQAGLSKAKGATKTDYAALFTLAATQAQRLKLYVWSDAVDPRLPTGNHEATIQMIVDGLDTSGNVFNWVDCKATFTGIVAMTGPDKGAAFVNKDFEVDVGGVISTKRYGIYVFTSYIEYTPLVTIGNEVEITGIVSEYQGIKQIVGVSYNAYYPDEDDMKILSRSNTLAPITGTAEELSVDQNVNVVCKAEELVCTGGYATQNAATLTAYSFSLYCQDSFGTSLNIYIVDSIAIMPESGPRVQTVDYFKSATSITVTGGLVTYTTSKGVKTYQIKLCRAADLSLTF
jgi:Micrococcal nuclease (thermonuclease) homologs